MNRNKLVKRMAGVVIVATMVGCAAHGVRVHVDKTERTPNLSTYKWVSGTIEEDAVANAGELDRFIREAVDAELTAKGYTRQARGRATFQVGYRLCVKEKVGPASPSDPSDRARIWQEVYVGRSSERKDSPEPAPQEVYEVGKLVVDMSAPEQPGVLWRGSAKSKIFEYKSAAERREHIRVVVRELLKKFPVKGQVADAD